MEEKKKYFRPSVKQYKALKERVAELENELQELKSRGFWARVFNRQIKKNEEFAG